MHALTDSYTRPRSLRLRSLHLRKRSARDMGFYEPITVN